MSYRAGIQGRSEPHIVCDGCGAEHPVARPTGQAFAWFLGRKAVPGWARTWKYATGTRDDRCPTCTEGRAR